MRLLALGLLLSTVAVLAFGTLGPRSWRVERKVAIAAPPSLLAPFVVELSRWGEWCVWTKARDPLARLTLSGPDEGPGSSRQWLGPKVGTGRATVRSAEPDAGVLLDVELEHGRARAEVALTWRGTQDGTELTWRDRGELPSPLGAWFLEDYEAALGRDVEASLAALRTLAEAEAGGRR